MSRREAKPPPEPQAAKTARADLLEVIAPSNAEGTRARVLRWYRQVGDQVRKDEPLLELETDKVMVELPAAAGGTLVQVRKQADEEVLPGDVLGVLRASSVECSPLESPPLVEASPVEGPSSTGAPIRPAAAAYPPRSPAVRRLLEQQALDGAQIRGSGQGGRITVGDIERHLAPPSRRPHTPIRRRVAEHMARSLAQAPHVTTLFEADLTRVRAHRARHAGEFERRGVRLTLTAYFIAACAKALAAHPALNSSYREDALELHSDINIGVGTALGEEGLIVPVIHRAQGLDLLGIAQRLGSLVAAARAGTLAPEDVRGGTFTVSNHGVGGSLLAAPIVINQPQVAILGIGKVERRVCVQQSQGIESIGIRSMCYLTLTIDHRALDAFQANAFLAHVVGTLSDWS